MTTTFRRCMTIATVASAATATLAAMGGSAEAATFGTNGIQFDDDTTVNFTFDESHGAYQSELRVYEVVNGVVAEQSSFVLFSETKGSDNGSANEWQGTFGNAVTSSSGTSTTSVKLMGGKSYTLGLASRGNRTVYSTTALNLFNNTRTQQAVFGTTVAEELDRETTNRFQLAAQRTSADPYAEPVDIGFDDRGNRDDTDFQDFVVSAQAVRPEVADPESVPEPATLAGLGLAASSLVLSRRRKKA